ncbi:tetratricopeptide repeat protein [Fuerstiella marisgermanici]|uniref:tetratricopeptide repeat protein n=1 Tax=Fuerstiella marisgermanici TaxID=1891926 RepID=UPI00097BF808|nr:tetratricopeptide repeat protein [Fuerstiella marisgermanici]
MSTQTFYFGIALLLLLFLGGIAHSVFRTGEWPPIRFGYVDQHLQLLESRRPVEMIPELRTAAAINFDDGYAQLKLLSNGYAVGDTDSILQGLYGLLSHTPSDSELHGELAIVLLNSGRFDDALVHSKVATKLNPDSAQLQITLGAVMLAMGRMQEAADAYRKALALKPDSESAQRALNHPLKNY